ncbi:hypothetical protein ACLOJK_041178 [Asimina triloba]
MGFWPTGFGSTAVIICLRVMGGRDLIDRATMILPGHEDGAMGSLSRTTRYGEDGRSVDAEAEDNDD